MKPILIIAIVIPIIVATVFVVQSIEQQNTEISADNEMRDEVIWQTLQKSYMDHECREKYIGQTDEMEKCFEHVNEEQRLNPPTTLTDKSPSSDCTLGWYITGYFLPIETDYSGETVEVSVNGVEQNYPKDFVKVVKIEGWGRTNAGNYLGWYDNTFTISDTYLDFHENDLIISTIAVDSSVIAQNSKVTIPTLPEPWNDIVFSASDVGPSIIGKHIDVFTGEGRSAEKETFRITSENNKVCMKR